MRRALLPLLLTLSACGESVDLDPSRNYALTYLDEESFAPRATIAFGPDGQVSGFGPCNRWSARLTEPLPAFAIDGVTATEMACDALAAEIIFFNALMQMTSAEITDGTLTLRDDTHRSMVFQAQD